MVNLMRTDTGYGLNRTAGSPEVYGRAGFGTGSLGVGAAANAAANAGTQAGVVGIGGKSAGTAQGNAAYAAAAGGATAGAAAGTAAGTGGTARTGAAGTAAASGTRAVQATSCETCNNRKYQDISTDAGVSFKAPAKLDPSVAASAVMSHEREHVALAEGRADAEGGRVISSITLETAICEECGRVYVSGGKAHITTITPVEQKAEQAAALEQMLPGAKKAEDAMPALPGAKKADEAMPALPGRMHADGAAIRLDTHGTDQFRKQYKQTMAGNFGLFFDSRT